MQMIWTLAKPYACSKLINFSCVKPGQFDKMYLSVGLFASPSCKGSGIMTTYQVIMTIIGVLSLVVAIFGIVLAALNIRLK